MSAVTEAPVSIDAKQLRGLRANSFAAIVMLLLEFGLGAWASLYVTLPKSDRGSAIPISFGRAVANGPVGLSLHALLGTLLLVSSATALIRAVRTRRPQLIAIAGIALTAILVAWLSGARFVGTSSNVPFLSMALATAVAILCYTGLLFLPPDVGGSDAKP